MDKIFEYIQSLHISRRKWCFLLIAAVLSVLLLSFGINRIGGRGPCFGNLDEGLLARKYVQALEQGDWETAAELWNQDDYYDMICYNISHSLEELFPKFRPVVFDGKTWYLRDNVEDSDIQESALNTLLYHHGGGMFTQEDLSFHLKNHGYFEINGYRQRSTPWGEYYLPENIQDSLDLLELGAKIDLMPENVYLDVMPLLEERTRSFHETFLALYGPPEELTEANYNRIIASNYVTALEALEAEGISFRFEAIPDFWHMQGCWHVIFSGTFCKGTETVPVQLWVGVLHEKVILVRTDFESTAPWVIAAAEALTPHYLPHS